MVEVLKGNLALDTKKQSRTQASSCTGVGRCHLLWSWKASPHTVLERNLAPCYKILPHSILEDITLHNAERCWLRIEYCQLCYEVKLLKVILSPKGQKSRGLQPKQVKS